MPKESLKDKLDGNELDLSLSSLETVPVNKLAALPKATHLDLSCNLLKCLPNDFTSLRHLVKLDLSKNQLTELPQTIGHLNKLKYLDLYQNQLQTLPVSLFHLKNLQWLDVKDNPLEEPIKSVAGDCLDGKQCKTCAKKVVQFMKEVQAEQERKHQKELEIKRDLEAKQKAEEDKAKQRVREERKREKERRRREHEAKRDQERQQQEEEAEKESREAGTQGIQARTENTDEKKKKKGGLSWCGVLFAIILGIVAVLVGLYFFCSSHMEDEACKIANTTLRKYWTNAQTLLKQYYT